MGSRKKASVSLTKIPVRFHGNLTKFRRNRLLFSREKKNNTKREWIFWGRKKEFLLVFGRIDGNQRLKLVNLHNENVCVTFAGLLKNALLYSKQQKADRRGEKM